MVQFLVLSLHLSPSGSHSAVYLYLSPSFLIYVSVYSSFCFWLNFCFCLFIFLFNALFMHLPLYLSRSFYITVSVALSFSFCLNFCLFFFIFLLLDLFLLMYLSPFGSLSILVPSSFVLFLYSHTSEMIKQWVS